MLISGKVLIREDLAIILLDLDPKLLHGIIAALELVAKRPQEEE